MRPLSGSGIPACFKFASPAAASRTAPTADCFRSSSAFICHDQQYLHDSRAHNGSDTRHRGSKKLTSALLNSTCRRHSVAPRRPHTIPPLIIPRNHCSTYVSRASRAMKDGLESHSDPPRHAIEHRGTKSMHLATPLSHNLGPTIRYQNRASVSDVTDGTAASIIRKTKLRQTPRSVEVRDMMRHVPHPVAIITSTDVSISPDGASSAWKGATVSSFNTVTLHPEPIVSFNIKKLSSTYKAIKNSGLFSVCLLDSTKASASIAQKFSRGNELSPFHREDGSLSRFARRQPSTALGQPQDAPQIGREPPLISAHPQSQFSVRCEHLSDKDVEIGDHIVVFGQVTERHTELHGFEDSAVLLYYVNGEYKPLITAARSGLSGRVSSGPKSHMVKPMTGDTSDDA